MAILVLQQQVEEVHVVSGVVIYVLTGALVLGLISTIHNWLMQDR